MSEALQIDPNQELREAVFSVQTNYVFKRMLMNVNKNFRKQFVRFLKVDVHSVEPIYFNGKKYKPSEHKENLFLFIDKNFELIGILKGSNWDKTWEDYENYDARKGYHSQFAKKVVIKNRTNMEQNATHILMITPEIRIQFHKKNKGIKPYPRFMNNREAYGSLMKRLDQYKLNKHSNMSHEEITENIKILMQMFTQSLFDKNEEEIIVSKKPNSRSSFDDTLPRIIIDLTRLTENYWDRYKRVTGSKNGFSREYNMKVLNEVKVELINYFNAYLTKED